MPVGSESKILVIGAEVKALQLLEQYCPGIVIVSIDSASDFHARLNSWRDGLFAAIFCGSAFPELTPVELAQLIKNRCPQTLKYFLTYNIMSYEPRQLLKNGITLSFSLPMDARFMERTIVENILVGGMVRSYRPVRVFDLTCGTKLDFATYLYFPLNKRYVRYTVANQEWDEPRLQKLYDNQMSSIYVDFRDLAKFYRYSAERLRELGRTDELTTLTERQERLRECVRSLFNDIFEQHANKDEAQNRMLMRTCQNIVSNFITCGSSDDWYQKLLGTIGESEDVYDHAANTSTFATLLAIGMGHPHPEDLAMAGLFHDLGLSVLPEVALNVPLRELNEGERLFYQMHTEKSLAILKEKRIIIGPLVEQAILQHHEKYDGSGYPKGLQGDHICYDAQILSYADQLDYITSRQEGRQRLTPLEAHEQIAQSMSIGSDVLDKIYKIFSKAAAPKGQSDPQAAA